MVSNTDINNEELHKGKLENLFVEEKEIAWYEIGYREFPTGDTTIFLEPLEQEEIQFDFVLDGDVQIVRIISYFKNTKRQRTWPQWLFTRIAESEVGWRTTSIYHLEELSGER